MLLTNHQELTFYFAGKISHTDWRHSLVSQLRNSPWINPGPATELPIHIDGIAPGLHYSGPFFTSCDHGCFHGPNTHGVVASYGTHCTGTPYPVPHKQRFRVATASKYQIHRADIVFAWLESETAYGTLLEIGFAHALGKPAS